MFYANATVGGIRIPVELREVRVAEPGELGSYVMLSFTSDVSEYAWTNFLMARADASDVARWESEGGAS